LLTTREVVEEFLYLTSNKTFNFGADPDHDLDPGIFDGISLPL